MAERPRPQVFISFIHEDADVANAVKYLVETELKLPDGVFQSSDQRQVFAGDVWLQKITDGLREARVILLMLSRRSVKRPWVNFEAGAGWLQPDKKVIPCCYGRQRKDALPHPYAALQAVQLDEMFDPDYLMESIHHHLGLDTAPPVTGLARAIRRTKYEEALKAAGEGPKPYDPEYFYDGLARVLRDFQDEEDDDDEDRL